MSQSDADTGSLNNRKEKWGSKLGVVLAVAGSAVGLGNFLRFPGVAVNNGGGAFMIPYFISFLLLGIPIAWCEWTLGRLGGRFGQNSAPGIMFAIWRRSPAKLLGALSLLIPVAIYMYYILLEAWCLDYCLFFIRGGFAQLFGAVTEHAETHEQVVEKVVGAAVAHQGKVFGASAHGAVFGGQTVWLVLACFLINFFIIYQGVTRGIERFCKWAMPALILCALLILFRVLSLPNISSGLGFMWNPDWQALRNPQVWLAAAGQIFFSLSVGFGLILCYSSYLRKDDDVVLSSLSASSTNEFCEVILAGLIVVPTAFLFLGAENARGGTFELGFVTLPAIMHFMPLGHAVGALWFGLLFLAAVTSSLSMLQPAIAFLEDGFGLGRRASVGILGVVTAIGAGLTMAFSRNVIALDQTDFWCNLCMIIAALGLVIMFGWVIGAERGVREMNRGADLHVPGFMSIILRFVTPAFLVIILGAWAWQELPARVDAMNPELQGQKAATAKAEEALALRGQLITLLDDPALSDEARSDGMAAAITSASAGLDLDDLPEWVDQVRAAAAARSFEDQAARDAYLGDALTTHLGLLPALDEVDQRLVVAGLTADDTLPARQLIRKVQRLIGRTPTEPSPQTIAFVAGVREQMIAAHKAAAVDANVARFVFLGVILFLLGLYILSDVACRNRIGASIEEAERAGVDWEAAA
jgi:NSS family neurotransmitter:Na+ symporter